MIYSIEDDELATNDSSRLEPVAPWPNIMKPVP